RRRAGRDRGLPRFPRPTDLQARRAHDAGRRLASTRTDRPPHPGASPLRAPRIELGTGVIPTYPGHPMMLAAQALTTQMACDGRLLLGIGLSHQIVIESMFALSFEKPARTLRE